MANDDSCHYLNSKYMATIMTLVPRRKFGWFFFIKIKYYFRSIYEK
jgi:hypothetical protein